MEEITVESLTLKELFDKQQMLAIPEYQRPYVWTPKEINKLLAQIKQHQERTDEKPLFYLGSIVLYQNKQNAHEIIDGQQRLTTLQILSIIKSKCDFGIKYSHPISLKNIKTNHNHFSNINFENIELDKINVTIVVVDSEDLAYSFFETLNTGGRRLSGTDILKAHHLRSITKIEERNKYAYNWEEKQKNLEAVNKLLVKARRIDYLKLKNIPDKFANSEDWKNVLTEDFAENVGKEKLDIGYSLVEIEGNTHRIISDKYSIRQPLNEGKNYINYLMSFSNAYNAIFETNNREDFYSKFNNKMIDQIDGTVDLRSFYQLCLLCFVDMFGKNNLLEFSLWLFRHIFCLRLNEQSRIYEPTVRNYIDNTKIIERIFHAYNYQEIITYLKEHKSPEIKINGSQVKQRFFNKCRDFFSLENPNEGNFDEKLKLKIEELVRKHKDEI
jgi:uncharacterized protein with ParB-like and HNH nuclease domain